MSEEPRGTARWTRGWIWGLVAVAGVLLSVLVLVLIGRSGAPERDADGTTEPTTSGSTTGEPTEDSTPPEVTPPLEVSDTASLAVPEKVRVASDEFSVSGGSTYLLSFEVSTVKPEGSPGSAMYLGVSLTCADTTNGESISIGGTENLLTGEPKTYRNQMLLHPKQSGIYACSISASNPRDDVDAAGATVDLAVTWTVDPLEGSAVEASSEERLPMTAQPGEREIALDLTLPVSELPDRRLDILSSMHVTTCTGINGSREAGRTWCSTSDLDEDGSDFDVEIRLNALDEDGQSCESIQVETPQVELLERRHHQLLAYQESFEVPETLCGDTLRASVVIENRGPASLVVHELSSSLLALEARA